jgi:hypothetical protein
MTQKIDPQYVRFDTAKLLKEKGFANIQIDYGLNQMLNQSNPPEQWQVVEWLRVNHGIWVSVNIAMDDKWYFELYNLKDKRNAEIIIEGENVTDFHNSPQEAYSVAFDDILNNLI